MARPVPVEQTSPQPEVSVVVTVFNEAASLEELYRRATAALAGRDYELIFVDDGSKDGSWELIDGLHEGDARVRGVKLKRNFGQHPAMHAGLVRARGEIVVTMDSDLQNPPEDLPKLIAAVESGYDVASGRRAARRDSWGRTLPSRLINGMLRRFTRVDISDFGCAFNAYRRDAVEPVLDAIGKQKFTKALVLSTGASVIEVDVGHAARADSSRYSPLRLVRTALSVLAGFWPQPIQWIGLALGTICTLGAFALGCYGVWYWIDKSNFPGPLFGGVAVLFILGVQGFILALVGEYLGRIQRDVSGRPLYTIDRELCSTRRPSRYARGCAARSRHRRRRVHLLGLRAASPRVDPVRGRLAGRAHLRRQPGEPRRRDGARAALVRARRHPRPGPDAQPRLPGRRDRQRGCGVARREVDRGGRVRVRDHERRGDADPARRRPRDAGRALHPDLVERGVRHRRVRSDGRGARAQPALALRRDQGRRRPARLLVLDDVRACRS